jgi:hypothetical protein
MSVVLLQVASFVAKSVKGESCPVYDLAGHVCIQFDMLVTIVDFQGILHFKFGKTFRKSHNNTIKSFSN